MCSQPGGEAMSLECRRDDGVRIDDGRVTQVIFQPRDCVAVVELEAPCCDVVLDVQVVDCDVHRPSPLIWA